jgi:hypothetical protein
LAGARAEKITAFRFDDLMQIIRRDNRRSEKRDGANNATKPSGNECRRRKRAHPSMAV